MINWKYIFDILGRFEGRRILKGYIPTKQGTWYPNEKPNEWEIAGQSGVTIGTGIDLGQQVEIAFKGLPETLIAKLRPYFGKKREDARQALLKAPLVITQEECEQLDEVFKTRYINENVITRFGRERFENAPKQAQAVAVSLCYQFGNPERKESPALRNAWEAIRQKDYKKAAEHLRDVNGWSVTHRYMTRRNGEASLLDEIATVKEGV